MYSFIVLCVGLLITAERINSQGDSYIESKGPVGAVGINSTITLTCQFRKTSKRVGIVLKVIDKNDQTENLDTWNDGDVIYRTDREGYVQYRHKVTGPGKYQCEMLQYEPDSGLTFNKYTLRIWQARLKDFPANFVESSPVEVNCSVRWVEHLNIAFTWFLGGAKLDETSHTVNKIRNTDGTFHVVSSLRHTFNRQDNRTYLKCEARDDPYRSLSSVVQKRVTVLLPRDNLTTPSTTVKAIKTTTQVYKPTERRGKYITPRTAQPSTLQAEETTAPVHTLTEVPVFSLGFSIQTTTTNSTTNSTDEGERGEPAYIGYRLYALFGVIGFLVVVVVPICMCWVKRLHKKESKKANTIRKDFEVKRASKYGQQHIERQPSPQKPPHVKTEGMVYAELNLVKEKAADTNPPQPTPPQIIHGTENMVEYASIAWDKNVIVG